MGTGSGKNPSPYKTAIKNLNKMRKSIFATATGFVITFFACMLICIAMGDGINYGTETMSFATALTVSFITFIIYDGLVKSKD